MLAAPPAPATSGWANTKEYVDNSASKAWNALEIDRLVDDARRVAKYSYIFSEMMPALHASYADRSDHAVWEYLWGALQLHPAVKSCVHKWNATVQSVGNHSAYMPGPTLSIRYDDVPTQVLEQMQPPLRTDCNDAFIATRAGMLTGAMFRALAKKLYGTLLGSPDTDKLLQRFAIPRVQTKWSKTLLNGKALNSVSETTVTHNIIDTDRIRRKLEARVCSRKAFNHGTVGGWELLSNKGCVWFRHKKCSPLPDLPSLACMSNPPDQLVASDSKSGDATRRGVSGTDSGEPGPDTKKISATDGKYDIVRILASDNTALDRPLIGDVVYETFAYFCSESVNPETADFNGMVNLTESANKLVETYITSVDVGDLPPVTPDQIRQIKLSIQKIDKSWSAAFIRGLQESDMEKIRVYVLSVLEEYGITSSATASMGDMAPAELIGGNLTEAGYSEYVYVSFPATTVEKDTTGSSFYRPHLYCGLRQNASRGAVAKFEDTRPASTYVVSYGDTQMQLAECMEEGNRWWNDEMNTPVA